MLIDLNGYTFTGDITVSGDITIQSTGDGKIDGTITVAEGGRVQILSGTYTMKVPAEYLPDGYGLKENDDGSVTVHKHDWDEGKVTTEPTETTEGVKTFTCEICGETKTESIPATGEPAQPEYTITVESGEHGTVTVNKNQAKENEQISITATPAESYEVDTVTVTKDDGTGVQVTQGDSGYTFVMPASDVTIAVKFVKTEEPEPPVEPSYDIDAGYMVNGTILVVESAEEGETVVITVRPDQGYTLDDLMVYDENGDEQRLTVLGSNRYSFVMPACDVTVYAYFLEIEGERPPVDPTPSYDIDKVEEDNGSITVPSGAQAGTVVTITVRPDEGYELAELAVYDEDGNELRLTSAGTNRYSFVMPDGEVTVYAEFRLIEEEEEEVTVPFTDVSEGSWYYDAVAYVYENGLMNGVGDNEFDPQGTATRAMVATILWRLEGEPVVNYLMTYDDVDPASWYGEAVRWATSEGVVTGYSDKAYGPDDAITREQLAVMLYRYAGEPDADRSVLAHFGDSTEVSGWATDAMAWAVENGIVEGDGSNLDPQSNATRAQIAAILMRFIENVVK